MTKKKSRRRRAERLAIAVAIITVIVAMLSAVPSWWEMAHPPAPAAHSRVHHRI
ncbi:hypothetical protein [Streptomyces luteogriseus]|uniref:hypothetical protein n=1 Tax=Streptomyces luteogriseus TaxID=68233 RepID=UPI003791EAEB